MKKIIIILFLAFVPAAGVLAGPNPHDSLLFDGENYARTETYYSKAGDECDFRVTYVKGNATGKIKKMTIYEACGIDTVYEYVNGAIEKYSVIQSGETVKTGPESNVRIELPDASVILLGPNTEYTLPTNACELTRGGILGHGSLWSKVKKLIGGGKFEVSTERACACVRGTEFTVEIKEENGIKYDVVKVYEGSVDIILKNIETKKFEDQASDFIKLSEDYQAGKITLEEYSKAMESYLKFQNESIIKLSQAVESGYMLKHDGKILGDPVPFNTTEDTWFKINE